MGRDKKTRLLMGVPTSRLQMGGPTTHLPYLVDYFEHHPCYEIKTFEYGSKRDGGAHFGKGEGLLSKFLNTIGVFFNFVYWVIRFRPQVIHINTAFDKNSVLRDVPFSVFCFVFRIPLLFKVHGSHAQLLEHPHAAWRLLIRLFLGGASRVGLLSEVEREEFIRQFGREEKMIVVKNIVLPLPERVTHFSLGKESNGYYGLFVSRIIEGKGLDDLIDALPTIVGEFPEFRLLIAGDGPAKVTYEERAQRAGVKNKLIWLGLVPNKELPALLKEADLFFFLSHFPEGMPMALVEAMRSGIPVITTPVRFARNYLKEGANALFTPVGDPAVLAAVTRKMITDSDLRNTIRANNPLLVKTFCKEIVGGEFDGHYQAMLG